MIGCDTGEVLAVSNDDFYYAFHSILFSWQFLHVGLPGMLIFPLTIAPLVLW